MCIYFHSTSSIQNPDFSLREQNMIQIIWSSGKCLKIWICYTQKMYGSGPYIIAYLCTTINREAYNFKLQTLYVYSAI